MKQIDVVGAVILNEQDQVLCALRSQQMSMAGHWEFPGGKLEPDEDPREALAREIREELACEITVGDLVADVTHPYPNLAVRLRTYYARLTAGTPQATEHERLAWLSRPQLRSPNWAPADLPTVDRLTEPRT